MKSPLVSIIMSTFNNGKYITDSIESVLNQTYKNWEFIIINDASTDNTSNIVKLYSQKEKRIKYLINKKTQGLPRSINKCLEISLGKYIARIDSDDIWSDKTKLEKQIDFLEDNPDYGLVGTQARIIKENGEEFSTLQNPITDSDIRNYILIENCFIHSSVVFRRDTLKKTGNYNQNFEYAEDYNLWLRIGLVSKFCNLPYSMVDYRINPKGITKTKYHFQILNTLKSTKQFKNHYPHYFQSAILWQLREFFPISFKLKISEIFKKTFFKINYIDKTNLK